MDKHEVNLYWLSYIWGYIGEGNKVDSISMVDMTQRSNVKLLVDNYIRPYFLNLPPKVAGRLKDTWKYALTAYSDDELSYSLESLLPPFETPYAIKEFYADVWTSMFPDEPWQLEDLNDYVDMKDPTSTPWDGVE